MFEKSFVKNVNSKKKMVAYFHALQEGNKFF